MSSLVALTVDLDSLVLYFYAPTPNIDDIDIEKG